MRVAFLDEGMTQDKFKPDQGSLDRWARVDRYFSEELSLSDPALEAAMAANKSAELPAIDVAPNQGKLLQLLARMVGARRILEIGTLGGYSAIWLARALPSDGRLITLEADPRHADVARAHLPNAGLAGFSEVRTGSALDTLPLLHAAGDGPFDLIFIDADKPSYPDYLAWSVRLSRPGTMIVADNVVRDGGVIDAASKLPGVQGVRRFLEALAAEPRV